MKSNDKATLNDYLSRNYADLGAKGIARLLRNSPSEKLYYKGMCEHSKIMSSLMREAHILRPLGPPFLPGSLTPGGRLSDDQARRPFNDSFASREAGIRAQLLRDNPYFADDVALVRVVLDIPVQGIEEVPAAEIPNEYLWWHEFAPLGARLLSNLWEEVHTAKAQGETYQGPELPDFMPKFLRNYQAQRRAVPHARKAPEWLNENPGFPLGQPAGYDEGLPLHRYLGILLYRYGLPPRLFGKVRTYLFSNSEKDLSPRPGDPLEGTGLSVSIEYSQPAETNSSSSLTAIIQGIDAFTTAQEFENIFQHLIVPAQSRWRLELAQIDFSQKYGRFPTEEEFAGLKRRLKPRARLPFTKPVTYLPLWKYMHKNMISLDKALGTSEMMEYHFDRRNAQDAVRRLEQLMKPVDSARRDRGTTQL